MTKRVIKIAGVSVLLAALSLGGCTTGAIQYKMRSYIGQPARTLFAKLGHPTSERRIAGSKVYIWSVGQHSEYDCKLRAIVDDNEIVTGWDLDGNQGGCLGYAVGLL